MLEAVFFRGITYENYLIKNYRSSLKFVCMLGIDGDSSLGIMWYSDVNLKRQHSFKFCYIS